MGRFAIKGLLSRKLRTALTAVAIVLGVAMISGTYVLTDSIDQAFDRVFGEIRESSSAVITGRSAFDLSDGSGVTEPTFDDGLLEEVRALQAVAAAEGSVDSDATQFIGDDGKAVVSGGAPNLGFSIANGDSQFNPLTLLEGSWPAASEVAIDKDTAADEGFEVGETIGVQAEGPVQRLRVSGIFQFSSGLSIGGATLAGFDLPTAQRLFDKVGKLDEIAIASKPDVPPAELVAQVEEILPPGTQVKTGEEQAQADAEETNEFISFLQTFLLAFAGIALFVGSFVIANSLSITIAQRTREFATLRTIGATNRQVLGSVIVEALVVGIVASIVGLFLGLLLAKGLFQLFDAVGFTLPNTGLVFEPRTIYVALGAGILVTVLASVYPGFRATTVPPIAAVREGAALPGEPLDALRSTKLGALLTAIGVRRRRIRHLRDSGEHALVDSARRARPARNPPRVRAVPVAHAWSGRVLRLRVRGAPVRAVRSWSRHDERVVVDRRRRAACLLRCGTRDDPTHPGARLAHVTGRAVVGLRV